MSINLWANIGVFQSVVLKLEYALPSGMAVDIFDDGGTVKSISFDCVNNYNLETGSFVCRFSVILDRQLCKEVDGEAVEEPMTCRVRFVIH